MRKLLALLLFGLISALAADADARGRIAVVSAMDAVVTTLGREEAEELYSGRTSALRDGTPVRLLDLPPGPVRDAFYEILIRKNPLQTRAHWSRMVFTGRARPPQQVAGPASLSAALQADPNAIGYLPLDAVPEGVRVLLILP